ADQTVLNNQRARRGSAGETRASSSASSGFSASSTMIYTSPPAKTAMKLPVNGAINQTKPPIATAATYGFQSIVGQSKRPTPVCIRYANPTNNTSSDKIVVIAAA